MPTDDRCHLCRLSDVPRCPHLDRRTLEKKPSCGHSKQPDWWCRQDLGHEGDCDSKDDWNKGMDMARNAVATATVTAAWSCPRQELSCGKPGFFCDHCLPVFRAAQDAAVAEMRAMTVVSEMPTPETDRWVNQVLTSWQHLATLVKPGMYKHYKGGFYIVVAVARPSTNGENDPGAEASVVYWSITKQCWWHRKVSEFMSKVVVDGVEVPRFVFVA